MSGISSHDDIKQASKVLQQSYPKIVVSHEVSEAVAQGLIVKVVRNGPKVVGVVIAERDVHEIYIRRIAVLESHRMKGYARGLINELLRLDNVKVLTLSVPAWEAGAVAFANRCSFHLFGIDMNNEGAQLWRLSARANVSTRNRLSDYFAKRPTRRGEPGRRC
jgi:GNAT superfamily N-acetyltransferase